MDAVWGEVHVTPLATRFLDVYEFQRMRNMKQLGVCNFVYSSAETSRFAHSIGVYHLARELLLSLHEKNPSLLISQRLIDLISIAALYHDIGHGPYSHLFDKITETRHEERSQRILRYVVKKYDIPVSDAEVEFMCQVIDPSETCGGSPWLFQIVSNGDVDVDRMDYLVRDSYSTGVTITLNTRNVLKLIKRAYIDNNTQQLVYPTTYVVTDLLESRRYMYERVYFHPTVKKLDELFSKALKPALTENAAERDLETFLKLSDSLLYEIYFTTKDDTVKKTIDKIFTRDF
jgi:HD superfamily phosphohydrolase